MNQVLKAWDKLLVLLSFFGFGAVSFVFPSQSMAVLPDAAQWGTYAEFILAALLLAYGTVRNRFRAFVAGHVLLVVGLLTVAGVVLFGPNTSVIATLLVGYAMAILVSLRNAVEQRQVLRDFHRDEDTGPIRPVDMED